MSKWVLGTIKKKICWQNHLCSVIVNAPIENFISGQYTKLAFNINGKKIQRAYSYVNPAQEKDLEFYLTLIPKGILTPYLFSLKENDNIMISKKSFGNFTLENVPPCKNLWMLATGTAIGPYLSMLQDKDKTKINKFEKIILVHAVRFFSDFSYLPLMKKIEKKYLKKIKIQTVISRENKINSLTGHLTTLIKNNILENKINLSINSQDSHVMLCGNPNMIHDVKNILEKRGLKRNLKKKPGEISLEHYW